MPIDAKFDSLTDRYQLLVGELNAALAKLQDQVVTYSKTTTLTAAQIRALSVTSQLLVPAPGAGKTIVVRAIDVNVHLGTIPYYPGRIFIGYSEGESGEVMTTSQPAITYSSGLVPLSGLNYGVVLLGSNQALLLSGDAELADPINGINTSTVHDIGTGYHVGDTIFLDSFSGSDNQAKLVVDTVDGNGGVTGYHFPVTPYSRGASYSIANSGSTSSNHGGTGFTLDVLSLIIGVGDGTWDVIVNYTIEPSAG